MNLLHGRCTFSTRPVRILVRIESRDRIFLPSKSTAIFLPIVKSLEKEEGQQEVLALNYQAAPHISDIIWSTNSVMILED